MQIQCDECNHNFRMNLKEKKHGNGIKETYTICPSCNKHYSYYFLDAECRKLQQEIRLINNKISKPANSYKRNKISEDEYKEQIDQIHAKMDRRKVVLKAKMDELKKDMQSKALK